jgi:hypothetical protein
LWSNLSVRIWISWLQVNKHCLIIHIDTCTNIVSINILFNITIAFTTTASHLLPFETIFLWLSEISKNWIFIPETNNYFSSYNTKIFIQQYDSSELGKELCPMSSSLPLRIHKVYIRFSFSDPFLRWLPPFVINSCHYQQRKHFPFYTLQDSGCVLISYSMLSLIIAWLG